MSGSACALVKTAWPELQVAFGIRGGDGRRLLTGLRLRTPAARVVASPRASSRPKFRHRSRDPEFEDGTERHSSYLARAMNGFRRHIGNQGDGVRNADAHGEAAATAYPRTIPYAVQAVNCQFNPAGLCYSPFMARLALMHPVTISGVSPRLACSCRCHS